MTQRDANTLCLAQRGDYNALPHERLGALAVRRAGLPTFWQIGIEEAEHVRPFDGADAFLFLQLFNALVELFHLRPVHLRAEMVLSVVTVIEEEPVIDFSVAAHAPCNRFVGVRAVMAVIAVQITETMAEIPERQKKQHEPPVNEMNWFRRANDRHHQKCGGERRQFEITPENIAVLSLAQLVADRTDIVSEKTQEHVAPRIFRFTIVTVPVD